MAIERPTIHALALFLAVVERGSMTAAAEATGTSQPAVSAQVKALERAYGTPLLVRGGRGVRPTEAGRLVTEYGHRVLGLVDELGRAIGDLDGLLGGRLVVGASSTVGEQFLPAYLGRYHSAHPEVELSLRIGNSAEVTRRVVERELDCAVVGEEPAHPALAVKPVLEDRIVAVVAPADALLRDAPADPTALSGRQFVLREDGSATRALAERCLRSAGCTPGHVIELGSNEAVKRAVEAGLGIGLLSTHSVEAERLAGLLEDLPLRGWSCGRSFWMIRRRDHLLSRAEDAFLALLVPGHRPRRQVEGTGLGHHPH